MDVNDKTFLDKIEKREKLKSIYLSEKETRKIGVIPITEAKKREDLQLEHLYYCLETRWKSELEIYYEENKEKYSLKELILFVCTYLNKSSNNRERLKKLIKFGLTEENKNNKIILECVSFFCDEYIRLSYKIDYEKSLIINPNSINDNSQILKPIYDEFRDFMKVFQIDLFNGIFDRKYALFKLLNEAFIDTLQFNDLIVLYRYLKFCLFREKPEKKNEEEKQNEKNFKQFYEKLLGNIEKQENNINQNIIKYCKKEKYSSEIYEMAKIKYKKLIEFFYDKIPIKDNNLIFSNGYFNSQFDTSLDSFENDNIIKDDDYNFGLKKEDDISNTLYFNYLDCSILLRHYTKDSSFYLKLIKCLIYICSNSYYPFCNIVNIFMFLCDIIHLHKKNIPLQYLSQFLYCIDNSIKNEKVISRFFLIPLFQLKILIFCHDIWDMLIENKIEYGYTDFYVIKNVIDKLNYNPWFRAFVENIESMNYLFYYFIFKKAVRKLKLNKDLYGSLKYLELVSKSCNDKHKELKDIATEWLEVINIELGLTDL
jgi:hypothetical protein